MKGFLKGFVYAGRGVAFALKERNFRFHICAAAFVTYFAARFYELSKGEWAAVWLTFALVMSAELVNTALERLCDRVTAEKDELIKQCKDIAAGAVLICAAFAVGGGIALFGDFERISAIWAYFTEQPFRIVLLIAAIAAAGCFVFLPKKKS
jgi:diacylglycerol kinase (ATP)